MATDYNSKYSGEQVEALLDQVASGNTGGGGGGTITEAEITAMGFTKNQGTITEVKMNGVSKGTSGVVDLGDVPSKATVDDLVDVVNGINDDVADLGKNKENTITDLEAIREGASKGATAVQPSSLAKVATSGSYNDLSNTPDIPTESTVSGWGFTKNAGTYSKPSGGIPRSDLDNEVITALRKAEQYTGTLTDVKMNGSALGANAGVVDIGNVVTSVKVNNATKSPSGGVVDLGSVGTYSKPSGGIPKSDLTSEVQTLLDKANVAVTKDNIVGLETIQTQGFNGSLNDMLYALPDEANGNEDDILLSRDSVKTINGQSIFGSGNIEISGGGSSSGGGKEVVQIHNGVIELLEKDKIYIVSSSNRTFEIQAIEELYNPGDYAEFEVILTSEDDMSSGLPLSIILPDNVYWANGQIPDLTLNANYELSIVGWETGNNAGYNAVITPFQPV